MLEKGYSSFGTLNTVAAEGEKWGHERQQFTVWWSEEVEKRVVLHGLHDCALSSSSFMLLYFLNHFHRHVLALLPVNSATDNTHGLTTHLDT